MFKECRYILPSGLKCKSPALRGQTYCYFHTGLRRFAESRRRGAKEPIELPSLEDPSGVQMAIMQVLSSLGASRLDPRHAGLYLYGIQLATQIALRAAGQGQPECPVTTLSMEDGELLAPAQIVCEPPADCLGCTQRDICCDFERYKGDVEILEAVLRDPQKATREHEEGESHGHSECKRRPALGASSLGFEARG
jgi:hypothetical protein